MDAAPIIPPEPPEAAVPQAPSGRPRRPQSVAAAIAIVGGVAAIVGTTLCATSPSGLGGNALTGFILLILAAGILLLAVATLILALVFAGAPREVSVGVSILLVILAVVPWFFVSFVETLGFVGVAAVVGAIAIPFAALQVYLWQKRGILVKPPAAP